MTAGVVAPVLVLALAPNLTAQQVFPSDVELVAVDVTVVDRLGRPATDLLPEDFAVMVGGRPRRIVAAQLIRHTAIAAPQGAPPSPATPPAFSTNRGAQPGRLILLVPDVESLSVAGARAVADAAIRFLGVLTPHDRVALLTIPTGPATDFTTDHTRVAAALRSLRGRSAPLTGRFYHVSLAEAFARFSPMGDRRLWCAAWEREVRRQGVSSAFGPPSCPEDAVLDAEARRVYDAAQSSAAITEAALLSLLRGLAQVEGPKTVVFLAQGLVTGASGGDLGASRRLAEIADAAAAARAGIYTIQVDRHFLEAMDAEQTAMPQTTYLDQQLMADGLEAIAGYTGGALLKTTASADFALGRVAAETSAAWLLSFEPDAGDRDGRPHDIRVRMKREGVVVRARPRFVVNPRDSEPVNADMWARRALEAPLLETDVPLTLSAYVLGGMEGNVRLVVAAEVGLGGDMADTAAVGYRLVDGQGQVAAGAIETGRFESVRSLGGNALYYLVMVTLKPGTYTLKLAAAAPSGRKGSVERAVDARLVPARGLQLSDLLVSEPGRRASGPVISVDGRLLGRTARSVLEVRSAAGPPSVQYEVGMPGATGARLMANATVHPTTELGCYNAEVNLDLGSLEAGRYELRAVTFLPDGSEAGRLVRPLELLERP
jgi:VWFA-related protein